MSREHFANRILLIVLVLFVGATVCRIFYPMNFYVQWLCFTAEASLVGGLADWFAVTALFKKPLGFPWHTAIIPNNRENLIQAIVSMVENDLLSMESISEKISQLSIADKLVELVDQYNLVERGAKSLLRYIVQTLNKMDMTELSGKAEAFAKENLTRLALTPGLEKLTYWALEQEHDNNAFTAMLNHASASVKGPAFGVMIQRNLQDEIDNRLKSTSKLSGFFLRTIFGTAQERDIINVKDASVALQQAFAATLEDLRKDDHPLRRKIVHTLLNFAGSLESDPLMRDTVEGWKNRIVDNLALKGELEAAINTQCRALDDEEDVSVATWMNVQAHAFWETFKNNETDRMAAERLIKSIVLQLLLAEKDFIGNLVRAVLESFTNEALSDFINEKVGDDLQWIRVNGSVVGGLVGALLFLGITFVPPLLSML